MIVGVKLNEVGKKYFFDADGYILKVSDFVIVETEKGLQYGQVVSIINDVSLDELVEYKKVNRLATKDDVRKNLNNLKDAERAKNKCIQLVKQYNLEMKIIDAMYTFDREQLIFKFLADDRIDFRQLAKELGSIFKTRIELRQIGVRDEVKRIGGNGICGRELCCCSFLGDFETVSIKMAKEQNISLNPSKISGNCGRLMCCLKYEQNVYEDKLERLPKVGAIVKTNEGEGIVDSVETLKEILRVKFKDEEDGYFYKKYPASEVKIIKNVSYDDIDEEEKEHLKELQELEKLEMQDNNNKKNNDDM